MNAYLISPGNIAAVCHVTAPDGKVTDCMYMGPNNLPNKGDVAQRVVIDVRDTPLENSGLPLAVRAAVNKHFSIMFSLPLENRGAYLRECLSWSVAAPVAEIIRHECSNCESVWFTGAAIPENCPTCGEAEYR